MGGTIQPPQASPFLENSNDRAYNGAPSDLDTGDKTQHMGFSGSRFSR